MAMVIPILRQLTLRGLPLPPFAPPTLPALPASSCPPRSADFRRRLITAHNLHGTGGASGGAWHRRDVGRALARGSAGQGRGVGWLATKPTQSTRKTCGHTQAARADGRSVYVALGACILPAYGGALGFLLRWQLQREVFRTSGNLDVRWTCVGRALDVRWMCGGCALDMRTDVRGYRDVISHGYRAHGYADIARISHGHR